MSVDKIIRLITELDDKGIDQLQSKLKNVDTENKNIAKSSDKASKGLKAVGENGGAIAVLDSLTGGLATKVRDTAEATKLFNVNLKATRTALIATGIGAFVVALGLVVAYWDDIVDFIEGANKKLEEQKALLESQSTLIDSNLKLNEAQQKLLTAQGKSTDELVRKEKQLVAAKIANLKAQQKINKQQLEAEKARVREVTFFEKLSIGAKQYLGIGSIGENVADAIAGTDEQRQNLLDREKALLELETEITNLEATLLGIGKDDGKDDKKRERQETITNLQSTEEFNKDTEVIQKRFEQLFGIEKMQEDRITEMKKNAEFTRRKTFEESQAEREKRAEEDAQKQIAREKALKQARINIAQNTLALVGEIAEEGSAVAKGVQVAQTVISTIQGVQNAYTTAQKSPITTFFPGYPIVQAGLAAAFGAVQVKKILSTDATGKTQPNLGGGSVGGGTAAPSFNVVGTSGTNQLAETLSQDQQPIQTYVVASDVTTQQELDNNIVQTASIG